MTPMNPTRTPHIGGGRGPRGNKSSSPARELSSPARELSSPCIEPSTHTIPKTVKYLSNLCRTPVRGPSEVCRLDVETLFLLGGAFAVSIAVAIQHFYDRFHHNGLYKTAVQRTAEMPGKIGLEVEAALNRVAASDRKSVV